MTKYKLHCTCTVESLSALRKYVLRRENKGNQSLNGVGKGLGFSIWMLKKHQRGFQSHGSEVLHTVRTRICGKARTPGRFNRHLFFLVNREAELEAGRAIWRPAKLHRTSNVAQTREKLNQIQMP